VERVFARHPGTSFIWLHVGNWPENLDYISGVLDRRPNIVVEFGARQADLGRSPRRTRQFFIDYQDRVLFGTDAPLSEEVYRSYFRWLETEDEYFDYYGSPGQGRWKIYGLGLPDSVLAKIYRRNAERVLSGRAAGSAGRERTGAVVHAHVARPARRHGPATIRHDQVGACAAVELRDGHVARRPFRRAERARDAESSGAIVAVHELPGGAAVKLPRPSLRSTMSYSGQ
jgi:hypothetical protein